MDNIINYVQSELSDWSEKPFNNVDSLLLTWLSYLSFPDICRNNLLSGGTCIRDVYMAEYFDKLYTTVQSPEDTKILFAAIIASPRFRNLRLINYEDDLVQEKDKQFAAVTFKLNKDLYYIAFRGTDFSFTGWKEDLNLSLSDPIPSQTDSLNYLEKMAALLPGQLMVGGHSKGGNLAVYAGAYCSDSIKKRLNAVYSYDGPGFSIEDLKYPGFAQIRPLIRKTLPQSSMIGMLFEQECDYDIIQSNAKGFMQHNPFSWIIENADFVPEKKQTAYAHYVCRTVNDWVKKLDYDQRELFINSVFQVLESTDTDNFTDLWAGIMKNLPTAVKKAWSMDDNVKKSMLQIVRQLASTGVENFFHS